MPPTDENLLFNLLDPVVFSESFIKLETPRGLEKWVMDPYQKKLMRDQSRSRVINKSKKTGISTTIAGESIHKTFTHTGQQIVFVSCYDAETKVYTKKGLKKYNEVLIGDEVLSLNIQTNNIEWKPVEKIHIIPYSGSMISFKGRSTDVLVTPNHKMLIKTKKNNKKSKIKILKAEECLKYKRVYTVAGKWKGINKKTLLFGDKKYRTKELFYLVGIFIGDGFLNYGKRKTGLSQKEFLKNTPRDHLGHFIKNYNNNPTKTCCGMRLCIPETDKSCEKIVSVLNGLHIKWYRNPAFSEKIRFYEKPLIKLFEECGHCAPNKKIPNWMLEYSKEYLEYLFQGLLDSDGDRVRVLHTISLPLTVQCIELAVKLGKTVCIKKYPPKKDIYIGNRKIKIAKDNYILSFSRGEHEIKLYGDDNIQNYDGIIWCPIIKDNHNLLIERNGKICFSGNTGQRIAIELLGKWYDMVESLPQNLKPKFNRRSVQEAMLSNGARILSLPSSKPGNIRGFGMRGPMTDVYVDEFAHVTNDRELWIVVRDFQLLGGKITLNSTPKGNRGKYYEIMDPLQNVHHRLVPKTDTPWSYHEIPYWFCPRLQNQEEFLKEDMTEIDFRQEYCCETIDESMSFFPYELIFQNQNVHEFASSGYKTKNPIYFGIDFGQRTSETIIFIVEEILPEHFKTLYIEVLPGVNYDDQVKIIALLTREYHPVSINIDASGPGGQVMEDMLKKDEGCGHLINGFDFTAPFKENIIIRLRLLFQRKKCDIPSKEIYSIGEKFERQLHSIRRTTTITGKHTRYSGKESGMDDMVWSLALAVYKEFSINFEPMIVQTADRDLQRLIKVERKERSGVIKNWTG